MDTNKAAMDLQQRWTELNQDKSSMSALAEEYAKWTLPYLYPLGTQGEDKVEMQLSMDSIGAQAVNHLSNKVVSTLFPPQSLFFRLHIDASAKAMLKAATQASGGSDEELTKALAQIDIQLAETEQNARDKLDMVAFRPQAVRAAQLLIITGNALEFHPDKGPIQVYSMRDYCVQRDLSGEVIEFMIRESKSFETFHPDIQAQIRHPDAKKKEYKAKDEVVIYSQIKLEDGGKFHLKQCADHVWLDTTDATWPASKLPWIVLTWNLVRGENYGRGLVGDYSGAFHAINVLTGSLLNIAAIMGDIKFLVKPSSLVDVAEINASKAGSYHSGNPEDITTIEVKRMQEAQFIQSMIERYEKQIGAAFLMASATTRNAERVTAEEIRQDANDLEMSNGGIYSRLAFTWQQPLAWVLLDQMEFDAVDHGIVPKVVTGMDSLSRVSELDNIKMWLMDLALLNGVPEDVRGVINLRAYAELTGTNRQVDYKRVVKSEATIQAEQQAAMQQQAQLEQQKAGGAVAAEAGKAAIQGAE